MMGLDRSWGFPAMAPGAGSVGEKTRSVLIIGGGNVAVDVARTLVRIRQGRAEKITLVCPETRDQMPALPEEVEEALEEGITIVDGWAPSSIVKKERGRLSVDFFKAKVSKGRNLGRLMMVRSGKENSDLNCRQSHCGDRAGAGSLFRSRRGLRSGRAGLPQIRSGGRQLQRFFAGGDVVGGRGFVADAIASGKMGALAIACLLEGKDVTAEFSAHQIGKGTAFSFQNLLEPPGKDGTDLKKVVSFEEVNTLFFPKSARKQAEEGGPRDTQKDICRGDPGTDPFHGGGGVFPVFQLRHVC